MDDLRSDPETCWLLLIRHGATANNEAHPPVLQGQASNDPLSATGRDQAERCGAFLRPLKIAAVYTSPLLRAQQTAEAIARPHELVPRVEDALTESHVGRWEGLDWGTIAAQDPELYRAFMDDPGTHPYPDGESFADVQKRALPVLHRLARAHLGQTIAIIAHNVVHRTLLAAAMDLPLQYSRRVLLENTGVSLVRYRHEKLKTLMVNSVTHMLGLV
jgi:alpha-ribazole phosphatase